jgi:hypothetical protein
MDDQVQAGRKSSLSSSRSKSHVLAFTRYTALAAVKRKLPYQWYLSITEDQSNGTARMHFIECWVRIHAQKWRYFPEEFVCAGPNARSSLVLHAKYEE